MFFLFMNDENFKIMRLFFRLILGNEFLFF